MKNKTLIVWLALSFAISVAAGISYFTMQQSLRQSANWPQAQMAADAAAALSAGQAADALVSGSKIDISAAQAPFLVIYDADGNAVASSATLNGDAPKLPKGVLDYTAQKGEDRVTWMPNRTIRIAAVVVKVQGGPGGAVLAGRSLKETESTIDNIGRLVLAAWAGSEAFLLVVCLLAGLVMKNNKQTVK
jgi:hypothetical protein